MNAKTIGPVMVIVGGTCVAALAAMEGNWHLMVWAGIAVVGYSQLLVEFKL
jgi:uncharacterized protein (DUF983 family)